MIGKEPVTYPQNQATRPVKPFFGFNAAGGFFRSEIKIENSTTRFAEWAVREILAEYLSPQDVHFLIIKENLGASFRCQPQWSNLNRFWEWPLAHAGTSLEQFIRSLGGKHPWLTDEYRWTTLCDAAEVKYGHESRLVHPIDATNTVLDVLARLPEMPRSSDSL